MTEILALSTEAEVATEVSLHEAGSSTLGSTAASHAVFLDSEFRYKLFPVVYSIIFVLGFIANCYVLFVLRRLRQASAMGEIRIYMTNLTVADLLFVSALPFWIGYYSRGGDWVYTDFLCRVTGTMFFINTYCSILFLGAISVNRYWAITQPLNAASSNHWRRGVAVTVTIWVMTLAMAIKFLVYPGINVDENNITRCFEMYHNQSDVEKKIVAATHFAIIGGFFIVFFLVVVCNLLIARALLVQPATQSGIRAIVSSKKSIRKSSSSTKPRGVKRTALQMLCAVVGVFVVCFLPHHVIQGPWVFAVLDIKEGWGSMNWDLDTRQALNDAHQITLVLMGLNCILDPIVYCFATRKFRNFIMAHIKKMMKGEACSQTGTTQLSMESKNHSQRLQSEHQ